MQSQAQVDIRRKESDRWTELVPPSQYERKSPNLFGFYSRSDDLRTYILQEVSKGRVDVPPQDIYFHYNAYASDFTVLFDRHKRLLSTSTIDHGSLPSFEALENIGSHQIDHFTGRAAFIWKSGKNNYGHMLIEMLSKCENLVCAGLTPITLIVPSLPAILREHFVTMLTTAYGDAFTLFDMRTPLLRVDELVVPGPVTRHNTQKSHTVLNMTAKLRAAIRPHRGFDKLYVSRSGHTNRSMRNESEIERLVESRGFTIVRPETMSALEQIATFSGCKHILGPLGAGLTNAIFAPADARFTVIDPGLYDFFFFDLAGLRGQQFNWIFTEPIEIGRAHV